MDTQTVLDRHPAPFGAGDDDAVANVVSGPRAPGTDEFDLNLATVQVDIAYITWHASCANFDIAVGTDTFIIQNGQIVAHTYIVNIVQR